MLQAEGTAGTKAWGWHQKGLLKHKEEGRCDRCGGRRGPTLSLEGLSGQDVEGSVGTVWVWVCFGEPWKPLEGVKEQSAVSSAHVHSACKPRGHSGRCGSGRGECGSLDLGRKRGALVDTWQFFVF